MAETPVQLTDFVNVENAHSVIAEIRSIAKAVVRGFDFHDVRGAFDDVVRLFAGKFPGYRKCNTEYHDLKHTTDVTLAMAGLIHGAMLDGVGFSERDVRVALISALLHDTGYIQTADDTEGTGAKYTTIHIRRSIEFMGKYFDLIGYSTEDFKDGTDLLNCTGLSATISDMSFRSKHIELLGKMLGTADLLGQMGDRNYLEKLLFLFYEFREAGIAGYTSELDLLRKTIDFYEMTRKRLCDELDGVSAYMLLHCKKRWGVEIDIYQETINRNIAYLQFILNNHAKEYRSFLRRGGMSKKLRQRGFSVDAELFS